MKVHSTLTTYERFDYFRSTVYALPFLLNHVISFKSQSPSASRRQVRWLRNINIFVINLQTRRG
ncbi:MAG: hypothetical protein ACTS6P_01445 [Candidatus Hodgkinia cicadicola]